MQFLRDCLTPELRLLTELARPSPELGVLRRLVSEVSAWESVLAAARRHGVAALAYRRLREHCADCVPAAVLQRLREHYRHNAIRNLALTRELGALLDAMRGKGVKIIPLRGPVMAARLYGDAALRECADLDVLVRRDELEAVCGALRDRGFRPVRELDAAQRRLELRDGCEVCYGREDGLYIEPHWELMPKTYAWGLRAEDVWGQAVPVALEGLSILQPSPEHSFVLLCAHAAKHGWETLRDVADVAWFLHSAAFDAARVRAWAERTRCRLAVLASCALAEALLGARAPKELQQADRRVRSLCNRVLESWCREQSGPSELRDWILRWRVLDGAPNKLRFAFRALLAPSVNDLELVRLPRPLFPLYYPLHAARMAVRYGLRPLVRRTLACLRATLPAKIAER